MSTFDWIAAAIVVGSLVYISLVLTAVEWLAALRKGQAVSLLPERGGRKWPLWVQVAMMVVGLLISIPLFYFGWVPLVNLSPSIARPLAVAGLVIYLAGFAFILWARRTLGRNWGISTSREVKLLDDHQLIQDGPYAFVRHPMYFGWWTCTLGLLLLYPVWVILLFLLFSLLSFSTRARREEAALAERFGGAWSAYRQRTKMLIPFLY